MPAFVDTNILVYAEDLDAGPKHGGARDLLLELWASGEGVLSVQVLQEFYVTVTRKLPHPLAAADARAIVEQYLSWQVVPTTPSLLVNAIDLAIAAQLSYWDAAIVAAAQAAGCDRLFSEDLNDGQMFGDLKVVNPIA